MNAVADATASIGRAPLRNPGDQAMVPREARKSDIGWPAKPDIGWPVQ